MISRRQLVKFGAGLSALALVPPIDALAHTAGPLYSTGYPALDASLGGGLRSGTLTVVIGPRGSGKTAFLYRLAKANGIMDASHRDLGPSDMLSIMENNGKRVGHLMSDAAEPLTTKEKLAIEQNPDARHAFLLRWFQRTHEVVQESGGIFVVSISGTCGSLPTPNWTEIPEYIIALDGSAWTAIKR